MTGKFLRDGTFSGICARATSSADGKSTGLWRSVFDFLNFTLPIKTHVAIPKPTIKKHYENSLARTFLAADLLRITSDVINYRYGFIYPV